MLYRYVPALFHAQRSAVTLSVVFTVSLSDVDRWVTLRLGYLTSHCTHLPRHCADVSATGDVVQKADPHDHVTRVFRDHDGDAG